MKKSMQRTLSMFVLVMVLFTNITSVFADSLDRVSVDDLQKMNFYSGHYHNNSLYNSEELEELVGNEYFTPTLKELGIISEEGKPAGIDIEEFKTNLDELSGVFPGFVQAIEVEGGTSYNPIHADRFAIERAGEKTPIFCLSYGKPSLAQAELDGRLDHIQMVPISELDDLRGSKEEQEKTIDTLREISYMFANVEDFEDSALSGYSELEQEWITGLALYAKAGRIYNNGKLIDLDSVNYILKQDRIKRDNIVGLLVEDSQDYVSYAEGMVDAAFKLIEEAEESVEEGNAKLRNEIGLSIDTDKFKSLKPLSYDEANDELLVHFIINTHDYQEFKNGDADVKVSLRTLEGGDDGFEVQADRIQGAVVPETDYVVVRVPVKSNEGLTDEDVSSLSISFNKDIVTDYILKENSGKYQEMIVPEINNRGKVVSMRLNSDLKVVKKDKATEERLEGVVFEFDYRGIDEVVELTTDEDGEINIHIPSSVLNNEDFEGIDITEIAPLEGYKPYDGEDLFVSKSDLLNNPIYTLEIGNSQIEEPTPEPTPEPVEAEVSVRKEAMPKLTDNAKASAITAYEVEFLYLDEDGYAVDIAHKERFYDYTGTAIKINAPEIEGFTPVSGGESQIVHLDYDGLKTISFYYEADDIETNEDGEIVLDEIQIVDKGEYKIDHYTEDGELILSEAPRKAILGSEVYYLGRDVDSEIFAALRNHSRTTVLNDGENNPFTVVVDSKNDVKSTKVEYLTKEGVFAEDLVNGELADGEVNATIALEILKPIGENLIIDNGDKVFETVYLPVEVDLFASGAVKAGEVVVDEDAIIDALQAAKLDDSKYAVEAKSFNIAMTDADEGDYQYEYFATILTKDQKDSLGSGEVDGLLQILDRRVKDGEVGSMDIGEGLDGATFVLYEFVDGEIGREVDRVVTKNGGYAEFGKLSEGYYVVKEVNAPEGYYNNNNSIKFYVSESDPVLNLGLDNLVLRNTKEVAVELEKLVLEDGEHKPLAGVEFDLLFKENEESDWKKMNKEPILSNDEGMVSYDKVNRDGEYKFIETKAPEGIIVNGSFTFEVRDGKVYYGKYSGSTETPQIVNYHEDEDILEVSLIKVDAETDNVLEDAIFTLTSPSGETTTITSNRKGEVKLTLLEVGEYSLKETHAPEGYNLLEDEITFEVKEGEEGLELVGLEDGDKIENEKIKKLAPIDVVINKTDLTTGKPVEGAIIEISSKDVEGFETIRKTSDAKGTLNIKLDKPGKYQFREVIAPDGYILNEEVFEFEVYEKDGKFHVTGDDTITNEPVKEKPIKPEEEIEVVITKVDKDTNKALKGAVIEVSSKDVEGFKTVKLTTDNNGEIKIKLDKVGKYQFKETSAPKGYELNKKVHEFEVYKKDGKLQVKGDRVLENKAIEEDKPSKPDKDELFDIRFSKRDYDTDKRLSGYEFELLNRRGRVIDTIKSNRPSTETIKDLEEGRYTLREIKSPKGYSLLDKDLDFEIDRHGDIRLITKHKMFDVSDDELIVYNKTFDIVLVKRDGKTDERLSGAKFKIKKVGSRDEDTITSDRDGRIDLSDIVSESGKYIIEEVSAPSGYERLKNEIDLTVYSDGGYELSGSQVKGSDILNYKIGEPVPQPDNKPTPNPTPVEPDNTPEDNQVKPKPDGVVPEEDAEEYEWDYEYDYDENDEIVVEEEVKTGEDMANAVALRVVLILMAVLVAVRFTLLGDKKRFQ